MTEMSIEQFLKGEIRMTIEVIFYFIGFLTCLALIAIIMEVNESDKEKKKELKARYRNMLKEQKIESIQNNIEIDIKI